MPGVTVPRGYPYPVNNDPINVAVDIQRLAEAIDDDMVVTRAIVGAVFTDDADLQARAARVTGNVVNHADGSQYRYDGTQWVRTYEPPGAWTSITLISPWTASLVNTVGTLQVRHNNNYLEFKGGAGVPNLGSNPAIGTMPAGFLAEYQAVVNPVSVPSPSGSQDFWSSQATIPPNAGGNISASAVGNGGPWYAQVVFYFGGIRVPSVVKVLA